MSLFDTPNPTWRKSMSIFNRVFGEPVPSLSVLELQKKLKDGKQPFLLDVR
jgi:hypothetical protein